MIGFKTEARDGLCRFLQRRRPRAIRTLTRPGSPKAATPCLAEGPDGSGQKLRLHPRMDRAIHGSEEAT